MIVTRRPEPGRVSVIVAGDGPPEGLRRALLSVAGQSHASTEILCVDTSPSGSARDAVEAVSGGALHLALPGGGLAEARNAGVERSSGQFVAFMDPGDVWEPGKLERQVLLMRENRDVGLVFSRAWLEAAGRTTAIHPRPGAAWESLFDRGVGVDDPAALYARILLEEIVPVSTVLARRVSLPTEGPFRAGRSPHEDHDFILRISEIGRFAFVDDPLVTTPMRPARRDASAAAAALAIFRDNVARNPWLLQRDPRGMRGRELDLLRETGLSLVREGRGREARPVLAEAWRRNLMDLRLPAILLASLSSARRPRA